MAESLALVWDLIARDSASPTFARVGASAEGASAGVGKLLGGLSALAVGSAIAASVDAAAKFQASMLLVQTQAGATAQEVADMSPKILALAGQVAQAPEALATSLYHVESTGLRSTRALDAVTAAAQGAKVGHADLEETTNALTATIASGMIPATANYADVMGKLNTIVGSGDMKLKDLNDALGTGLLVQVKQYGVTLNDVGAALADFGDNNIRGADAATKVRMAVQAIESPGKGAAAALGRIGLTTKQIADDEKTGGLNKALTDLHDHLVSSGIDSSNWGQLMTDAFTKKAGGGIITLIGTFDRFKQKYEEVSKGADSFGNAWDATTKTASFQFSALKDSVDAVSIKLGTNLLPILGGLADWFTKTAIPNVEKFAGSVQSAFQSQGVQDFLHNLITLGGEAWSAIQTGAHIFADFWQNFTLPQIRLLGDAVKLFAELPGPVQLAAGAFVALRIAAGKGMFDGLLSTISGVGGAFRGFSADVSATAGVLEQNMPRSLATFSAVAQTTAERGLGALKSAGSGLLNMLGGPWGVTLAGSAIAIGQWSADVQQATQDTKDWANELINGGMAGAADVQKKYLDQYGGQAPDWLGKLSQSLGLTSSMKDVQDAADNLRGSMTRLQTAQADVNTATANYEYLAGQYGPNSAQARAAAAQLQSANQFLTTTQRDVNTATQSHIDLLQQQSNMELASVNSSAAAQIAQLQLTGAIDDYNAKVKDGTLKGDALKITQANLEQQAIRTAQQQAQAAADTAKANGVTDTSITYNNTLHDALGHLADEFTGPVHDALVQARDATGKAAIQTNDFRDATQKLGLMVGQAWPDGTKVVQQATAQQIEALKQLGFHVTTLPGSDPKKPQTIFVTTDTSKADQGLSDFMKRAQDLGFVGAMWNVGAPIGNGGNGGSPIIGMPGIPGVHKATGGMIYGPGTGTSDSVPAMLSNGEFVVNAKATAQHSALLHAINSDAIAKYAQGGLVWPAALSAAVMGNLNGSLNAQVNTRAVAASAGGAARWAPLVDQVLAMLGISRTAEAGVLSLINSESGGNPNAVNRSDSNWLAGHPSMGLTQTIPSTFARWRSPNLPNNILDPAASIYAGVNYALHNYGLGMLMGGGNHGAGGRYIGYRSGTNYVPTDQFAMLHRGEAVVPADKNQGAPYRDGGAITLQLDREAVTDLLDGRIVNFADGMYHRGEYNG